MTWRLRDIPRTLIIGDELWDVRFVKGIPGRPSAAGVCDDDSKEILIDMAICKREKAKTFIHEVLHALDFEYNLNIPHELIYKLEEPIYSLIRDNWRYVGK